MFKYRLGKDRNEQDGNYVNKIKMVFEGLFGCCFIFILFHICFIIQPNSPYNPIFLEFLSNPSTKSCVLLWQCVQHTRTHSQACRPQSSSTGQCVHVWPPSLRSGRSAAWPSGNIVLTKIPMLPLGESIPPTTLKPSPFFPGP